MTKYSKFNIIYRLQKWLDSVPGQTFMNYAYSWGASIVILGTLFKLTVRSTRRPTAWSCQRMSVKSQEPQKP